VAEETFRFLRVFKSDAIDLPESKRISSFQTTPRTTVHFTPGPIRFGAWHSMHPPLLRSRDGILLADQELFSATPVEVELPECHTYVAFCVSLQLEGAPDTLEREIGLATTVISLAMGPYHFRELVYEGTLFSPDIGKLQWRQAVAQVHDHNPQQFADYLRRVSLGDTKSTDRRMLMARWYAKAVCETNDTEDKFMYYWTVLEILVNDSKPLVRHLVRFLAEHVMVNCNKDDPLDIGEIKTRLGIGRLYGTRRDLVHRGRLSWSETDRSKKFKLLRQLCSECLRYELGLPLTHCLEDYMSCSAAR
jgi:hypothetical protein